MDSDLLHNPNWLLESVVSGWDGHHHGNILVQSLEDVCYGFDWSLQLQGLSFYARTGWYFITYFSWLLLTFYFLPEWMVWMCLWVIGPFSFSQKIQVCNCSEKSSMVLDCPNAALARNFHNTNKPKPNRSLDHLNREFIVLWLCLMHLTWCWHQFKNAIIWALWR